MSMGGAVRCRSGADFVLQEKPGDDLLGGDLHRLQLTSHIVRHENNRAAGLQGPELRTGTALY